MIDCFINIQGVTDKRLHSILKYFTIGFENREYLLIKDNYISCYVLEEYIRDVKEFKFRLEKLKRIL